MRPASILRSRLLVAALVLLPALLLAARLLHAVPPPRVDFTPIWLAGRMWQAGANPYGARFVALGATFYADAGSRPDGWFYPPQWWLPCVTLARLTLHHAVTVWTGLCLLALAVAIALLWRASNRLANPPPGWLKAIAAAYLLTMEPTNGSLFLGQTSLFLMLGIALVLAGAAERRRWLTALGMIVLLLKPQVGIAVLPMLLVVRQTRWPAVAGGLLSAAAALPPIVLIGLGPTLGGWLASVLHYGASPHNIPAKLVGLVQLGGTLHWPPWTYLPLAAALFVALRSLARRRDARSTWLALLGAMLPVLPLHTYDLSFAGALIFAVSADNRRATGMLAAGLLLLHRANTIGHVLGHALRMTDLDAAGARVATVAVVLLLVAIIDALRGDARATAPSGGAAAAAPSAQ